MRAPTQAGFRQPIFKSFFRATSKPCVHLLAGRTFTDDDNLPGRDSVIVDEALAAKAFPASRQSENTSSFACARLKRRLRSSAWSPISASLAPRKSVREQIYFPDAFPVPVQFNPGPCAQAAIRLPTKIKSVRL